MITRIRLQNVLAFRNVEIETRPLTILSGTNSAGKSSVLHALAVLRQSSMAKTLPEALLLNGELVQLGTGRDILHSEPEEITGIDGFALRIAVESAEDSGDWLEGFGSLDPESLGEVIDALERLREADLLVGVISHVPELAERIGVGLQVHKDGNRSVVEPR